jgi:tripartite-type tricarboxylate transporter receptor subunit TctC
MKPTRTDRRRFLRQGAAALALPSLSSLGVLLALQPQSAMAQAAFPSRPLRIVVPFAPGGPSDLMARAVGKVVAQNIGQAVVVDNKPGGGGVIALNEVARSPADGYSMAFPSIQAVTNPWLMKDFPFDMARDFDPVTVVGFIPHAVVVRPDFPAKTLAELVTMAKDKPDSITYASSGNGTSAHLACALFADRAGIRITHIPYKGAGPALQGLLGDQVHMMFLDMGAALAQIRAGKLRVLAIAPARRVAALPDVASIAEQGYPGFDIHAWYGLLVRGGTPPALTQKLQVEVRKALDSQEVRDLFRLQSIEPGGMPPAEFGAIIRDDLALWKRTVERLKLSI